MTLQTHFTYYTAQEACNEKNVIFCYIWIAFSHHKISYDYS